VHSMKTQEALDRYVKNQNGLPVVSCFGNEKGVRSKCRALGKGNDAVTEWALRTQRGRRKVTWRCVGSMGPAGSIRCLDWTDRLKAGEFALCQTGRPKGVERKAVSRCGI